MGLWVLLEGLNYLSFIAALYLLSRYSSGLCCNSAFYKSSSGGKVMLSCLSEIHPSVLLLIGDVTGV